MRQGALPAAGPQGTRMEKQEIPPEECELLAQILEKEKRGHSGIRTMCLFLFVFSFILLLALLGFVVYQFTSGPSGDFGAMDVLQVLAPIAALMIGFFTSWWAANNCVNSIERSLFAARHRKWKLFLGFVEQLQCASKKKRSMLMDVVGSLAV